MIRLSGPHRARKPGEAEVSIKQQIFWARVRCVARYHVSRAIEMLLGIGATLAQAVRFVVVARAA